MDSYNIEGDDTLINVSGTLGDTGRVTIMKDGDEYIYDKTDGKYSEDIFPKLQCDDGSFIDEGPVKQKIQLPDGTLIEKGVTKHKATLPNGDVIESNTTTQNQSSQVSIQSDSSSSVNITLSVSNTEVKINSESGDVDVQENGDEKTQDESKLNIISNFLPSPVLAGFIGVSLVFNFSIILYICTFIYLYQVSSNLYKYIQRYKNNTSEKDQMNELEEIKNEYANNNMSENELESKLDNYFEDADRDYNLQYN